jgi:hypothetical protein
MTVSLDVKKRTASAEGIIGGKRGIGKWFFGRSGGDHATKDRQRNLAAGEKRGYV